MFRLLVKNLAFGFNSFLLIYLSQLFLFHPSTNVFTTESI